MTVEILSSSETEIVSVNGKHLLFINKPYTLRILTKIEVLGVLIGILDENGDMIGTYWVEDE